MSGERVRVKKSGESGTVVYIQDGKFVVQFFDGQAPYRLSFSKEELEFLPAYDARKAFEKKLTEQIEETAKPFTDGSERKLINPKKDEKDALLKRRGRDMNPIRYTVHCSETPELDSLEGFRAFCCVTSVLPISTILDSQLLPRAPSDSLENR
jgi:uncharacterized protein YodC (DUF2158 family)